MGAARSAHSSRTGTSIDESAPPDPSKHGEEAELLGIGRAAVVLGVSERALRYYQQIGLLTPSGRTPGGMRRYSRPDLDRVRRIRELQDLLGFNLDEIRGILADEDRLAELRLEYHVGDTGEARRLEIVAEAVLLREGLRGAVEAKLLRLHSFLADLDTTIDRLRRVLVDSSASDVGAGR